jgi:hypothetical protein
LYSEDHYLSLEKNYHGKPTEGEVQFVTSADPWSLLRKTEELFAKAAGNPPPDAKGITAGPEKPL